MPSLHKIVVMALLTCAIPTVYANDAMQTKIQHYLTQYKKELPYQQGDVVVKDAYLKDKHITFLYDNINPHTQAKDYGPDEIHIQNALLACSNTETYDYMSAGYSFEYQMGFIKGPPLSTKIDIQDCLNL